ncbi:hypothetical protein N027_12770 [Pseudomonas syringae USA007]|uniref:Lipoprotein n=1 Tax=Pseudomonas syringae USA007 TaxID=1357288 RepID=A0AAU8MFW8_PSESX|nr:hypothetical protein [Pseudomonas syringae]MCR8717110.1 hypothetical protein [Pseudomonas syringae]
MKHIRSHLPRVMLGLMISVSLVLAGCANNGTGSSMLGGSGTDPDPRLTKSTDSSFFSTSGLTACAAAAGVGILACAVASPSDKVKCMVVAGIAACGVAMGANYYYDYRRSKYSNTAQRLQLMNDDVKADTEKVAQRTYTLQQVINDDKERIAGIQKSIKTKTLDKAKAQQEIASVDSNLAQMNKDLTGMRSKVAEYKKTADLERASNGGTQVTAIDGEISKMNSKVASLQKEVDGLYSQRQAITLG